MAPCENASIPTTEKSYFFQDGGKTNGNTFLGISPDGSVDCSLWNSSVKGDVNCSLAVAMDEVPVKLNKFQIIKAVVLAGVTIVIMISICRMVFQLFVRYNVRQDR